MGSRIIALDADGVLLDYHLAYADAWQRAFGVYPQEKDPDAYWPMDRWRSSSSPASHWINSGAASMNCSGPVFLPSRAPCRLAMRSPMRATSWCACRRCPHAKFRQARERNLRRLGFPIETVYATDNTHGLRSPKADLLNTIRPLAFVDDFLPYLVGVDGDIHSALIMRGANGSPNQGEHLALAASQHGNLLEFARWWNARSAQGTSPMNAGAIR